MKKQKEDGFGNKIDYVNELNLKLKIADSKFLKGDKIYIHNKEGSRIATYEVTK
jgi:hypothetical protein